MLFLIAFSTESKVEESAEFHASKVPSLETRSINGTLPVTTATKEFRHDRNLGSDRWRRIPT